ncbi:hypothetical protein CYMTET_21333 [Cymbomonas tetramitiformis]|uniref:Uncharacterized protein n=1 Tax=Cymbomonas tetramitiformis TaxID=36881 RepID=A0AAE0L3A0_9CHLO|nr:hypothetical protein CYMTET_21333 [Cymbomonas tetramitiformis]
MWRKAMRVSVDTARPLAKLNSSLAERFTSKPVADWWSGIYSTYRQEYARLMLEDMPLFQCSCSKYCRRFAQSGAIGENRARKHIYCNFHCERQRFLITNAHLTAPLPSPRPSTTTYAGYTTIDGSSLEKGLFSGGGPSHRYKILAYYPGVVVMGKETEPFDVQIPGRVYMVLRPFTTNGGLTFEDENTRLCNYSPMCKACRERLPKSEHPAQSQAINGHDMNKSGPEESGSFPRRGDVAQKKSPPRTRSKAHTEGVGAKHTEERRLPGNPTASTPKLVGASVAVRAPPSTRATVTKAGRLNGNLDGKLSWKLLRKGRVRKLADLLREDGEGGQAVVTGKVKCVKRDTHSRIRGLSPSISGTTKHGLPQRTRRLTDVMIQSKKQAERYQRHADATADKKERDEGDACSSCAALKGSIQRFISQFQDVKKEEQSLEGGALSTIVGNAMRINEPPIICREQSDKYKKHLRINGAKIDTEAKFDELFEVLGTSSALQAGGAVRLVPTLSAAFVFPKFNAIRGGDYVCCFAVSVSSVDIPRGAEIFALYGDTYSTASDPPRADAERSREGTPCADNVFSGRNYDEAVNLHTSFKQVKVNSRETLELVEDDTDLLKVISERDYFQVRKSLE